MRETDASQKKLSLSLVILHQSAGVFFIPVTHFMALWLGDLVVSAAVSKPCPVTLLTAHLQPTLEGQVLPADLEPRTIVVEWSRSCDGLNVTVGLPTFGPETADRKQDPQLLHLGTLRCSSDTGTHLKSSRERSLSVCDEERKRCLTGRQRQMDKLSFFIVVLLFPS